jgi:hypothetical protein
MQIEAGQSVCPACGADGLEIFPVLHHMMCAYVGPEYDFVPAAAGYTCPKILAHAALLHQRPARIERGPCRIRLATAGGHSCFDEPQYECAAGIRAGR